MNPLANKASFHPIFLWGRMEKSSLIPVFLSLLQQAFPEPPVSSGICSETYIPYAGTIQKCTVLSTATGSLTFDISATGYAAYPNMTSLCGSNRPFLNNDRKFQDSTLTGWNTRINAGDTVKFSVASGNNLINQVTIVLDILVD